MFRCKAALSSCIPWKRSCALPKSRDVGPLGDFLQVPNLLLLFGPLGVVWSVRFHGIPCDNSVAGSIWWAAHLHTFSCDLRLLLLRCLMSVTYFVQQRNARFPSKLHVVTSWPPGHIRKRKATIQYDTENAVSQYLLILRRNARTWPETQQSTAKETEP